ncbi:MAG: 5'-nucleotidase C-terminal domain-containing protein [Deltaproteobacteria bacterium]|nr:5'-nucleotidase C-terminal domain-containing protein [Deltaproteobacteria bacterium]
MKRFEATLGLCLVFAGCGGEESPEDVGPKDAGKKDVGFVSDTGVGPADSGVAEPDSGEGADTGSAHPDATASGDTGTAEVDAGRDAGSPSDTGGATSTRIQLLSISDWHGQLDPLAPAQGSTITIGGAAVLSTYFARERAEVANTLLVTAGDAFGGTPPLSSLFEERPAILALNAMGLAVDSFGNHNFDRGLTHLQQMIDLSDYTYVSSNLGSLSTQLTNVASPFHIETIGGVKVAFIGITNPDAPTLTFPGRMGSLTVNDPVTSALAARTAAVGAGAQVFVALVHLGATAGGVAPTGPLLDFANGVTGFHVIFGDHTDIEVNQVIHGAVVLENRSKGRTYGRVRLAVDMAGAVAVESADIVTPLGLGSVTPDPAMVTLLEPYRAQLAAQLDVSIGTATGIFPRGSNVERLGEVAIGNLFTDAMRDRYGVQLAFINGGGIRAPLPSSYAPANTTLRRSAAPYVVGPPYDLVLGDAYTVQPFGNTITTRTVTGQQVWALLEHGVSAMPAANGRFPQVSGMRFTYTASNAAGSRIVSVTLDNGTPIPNDASMYSLATTDFINNGGDGYTMLADGSGSSRELDAVVLAELVKKRGTISPAIEGRITRLMGPAGVDGGVIDAGAVDAGRPDAALDAGFLDASVDASVDAGPGDVGSPDSGFDAGRPDASADAGVDGGTQAPITPEFFGDLVITEIMKDPSAVADSVGEWFEVYNPTGLAFDLTGCYVYDLGTDSFIINGLVVGPGEYATLASSATPGFTPDYVYAGFLLANADDEVALACPTPLGDMDIDYVLYDNGVTFPDSAGASMSLDAASIDPSTNDFGNVWCDGVTAYNSTDLGTPGAPNPTCP